MSILNVKQMVLTPESIEQWAIITDNTLREVTAPGFLRNETYNMSYPFQDGSFAIVTTSDFGVVCLQISSSNIAGIQSITNPYALINNNQQPKMFVSRSSNQSISNNTLTIVQFNTVVFDTNNIFDAQKYSAIPNVAGYYQVNSNITFNSVSTSTGGLRILLNGSEYLRTQIPLNNSNQVGVALSGIVPCNGTTDAISIAAIQSSGFTVNLLATPCIKFSCSLIP